jgi:hypothetical protein
MKKVATKHKCACLEWVVYSEQDAKICYKDYGFRPVRRKGNRYAGLEGNEYLLEFRL